MKSFRMVAIIFLVLCGVALSAQTVDASSSIGNWIGIWNGTLEGQPGVTLTLAENAGQLGGTIVFNMIIGRPPNAHIGGSDVLLVTHPLLDGDTLSFQVTRKSDAKLLQITVKSLDGNRLALRCRDCGDGPPMTLVKFRP